MATPRTKRGGWLLIRRHRHDTGKFPHHSKVVNQILYVVFSFQMALVTIADVMANVWIASAGAEGAWYLRDANSTRGDTSFQLPNWIGYWFTFFSLLNNFVPM